MKAPDHNVSEKMPPRSRLSRFLCWMTAGPMPRSLKMAKKAMSTVAMFTTPNSSGENRRASTPDTTSVTTMPAYFAIEV